MRREKEAGQLAARLGEEQQLLGRNTKQIKELGGRVEQLEEELEAERGARTRSDKQREQLNHELEVKILKYQFYKC